MCGFAGFIDPRQSLAAEAARVRLKDMCTAIRFRGPDADGISVEENGTGAAWAGLGHRRLSILDISPAGAQPMASHCGRYLLAYNGEIYNFHQLRAKLEARGKIAWRGHSDTEILLQSIAQFGVAETLAELDGMFAFAVIDRETRSLTLARDAFGEKPLVYGLWDGVLLFGSELNALRAWPGFAPEEDADGRAALMQYGCIPAPATIHQGIFKLPPASMVEIPMDAVLTQDLPTPVPWWDMVGTALDAMERPFEGNFEDAVEAFDQAFATSIKRRMVSDVPLGALLSGGIDSTLTTAVMQRMSNRPVRSFTIGMSEKDFNEAPYAEAVARHLGTEHETLMLSAQDLLDEVPSAAARHDEPFADSSQVPTYLVSRMAREHVTVVLSGDGGDELFAGYNRHFRAPQLWSKMQRLPTVLRVAAGHGLAATPPSMICAAVRVARPLVPRDLEPRRAAKRLQKLAWGMRARDREGFQDTLWRTGLADTVLKDVSEPPMQATDPRLADLDFAPAAMLADTGRYLHDDILTKVDRASMAVSLESRTPFLNRDLFRLAWQMPHDFKAEKSEGKRVLREMCNRYVPREIMDRPKAGFAMPIGRWLRGPLVDWAESHLSTEALKRRDVFDVGRVRAMWKAHRSGRRDHETQLWNVLMYQSWHSAQDAKAA